MKKWKQDNCGGGGVGWEQHTAAAAVVRETTTCLQTFSLAGLHCNFTTLTHTLPLLLASLSLCFFARAGHKGNGTRY